YDVYFLFDGKGWAYLEVFLVVAPALLVGLFQSRRQFRREAPEDVLSTMRYLLAPAAITFIVAFGFFLTHVFAQHYLQGMESALLSAHANIRRLQFDLTNTDEAHPRRLDAQEFATVISSEASRRWLGKSSIDVYTAPHGM